MYIHTAAVADADTAVERFVAGDLAAACAVAEGEITATEVYVEDVKIAIGRDRKAVQAERQLACQLGFCGHGHVLRQAVCT